MAAGSGAQAPGPSTRLPADGAPPLGPRPRRPRSFDAVGGVSAEANNESVAALAGIAVEDILLAEWRNSPYRPCHYVAIDQANQCIVVSIR